MTGFGHSATDEIVCWSVLIRFCRPWRCATGEPGGSDDVASGFRLVPASPTAFRRPRYLVGTRAAPELEETLLRTLDARESGELEGADFWREIENLRRLEAALAERERRAESRKPGRPKGSK